MRLLLLLLATTCLLVESLAQDPLHRPWRRPESRGSSPYRGRGVPMPTTRDWSQHIMDLEEAKKDPRTRLWAANLKSRRPGHLSWTSRLIWSNVLLYALQVLRPSVTALGLKLSDKIIRGQELYRLITPVFLHAGIFHLMTNMQALHQVGTQVEKLFGPGRYLATYVAAGVAGNLVSAYLSPNPALGASGAVFGIFGAYYVFLSRHDFLLGSDVTEAATTSISVNLATNLFLGWMNPMIDNWAHLGGAVGGAAIAYLFGPRLYLSELPTMDPRSYTSSSSSSRRILLDRPILRLPRSIEAGPERAWKQVVGIKNRIETWLWKHAGSPQRPWSRSSPRHSEQFFRRRFTPNRSIKPDDV